MNWHDDCVNSLQGFSVFVLVCKQGGNKIEKVIIDFMHISNKYGNAC
jgi:hypothetical protein